MGRISQQERLFIEAYEEDRGIPALEIAGYQGSESQLNKILAQLLSRTEILQAIKERDRFVKKTNTIVADRHERQSFWSEIMRNKDPHAIEEKDEFGVPKIPNIPLQHRLRASEMLAKSEGDFVDNVNVQGNLTISDLIQKSFAIEDQSIEAIEAEYELLREQKLMASSLAKDSDVDDEETLEAEDKPSLEDFI